jgi:hypothetical protein
MMNSLNSLKRMALLVAAGAFLTLSALSAPFFAGVSAANAQTLDEIVSKLNEKQGGVAKHKAINSQTMKMTMIFNGGAFKLPSTIVQKRNAGFRTESTFQGMSMVQAVDAKTKKGWSVNPMQSKDAVEMNEETMKAMEDLTDIDGPFIDTKDKGYTLELLGKEDLEGAPAFKVKVTKKNGNESVYFVDAETYLVVKTTSKSKNPKDGSEVTSETFMSNFKEVGGGMHAFTMETRMGGKVVQQMEVEKMEFNTPVDDKIFMMPAKTEGKSEKK